MSTTTFPTAERRASVPLLPRTGPVIAAIGGEAAHDAQVLRAAQRLAAERGARLMVVAVAEPLPVYFGGGDALLVLPPDEPERRRDALRVAVVDRVRDVLGETRGYGERLTIDARYGDVADEITNAAREADASLIVMGIGHHRPLDRVLGAEMALRVVRLADRPVLAVAGRFAGLPRRVVMATDFSASSTNAAATALPLLDPFAALTFVHVWQRVGMLSPTMAVTEAEYVTSLPERLDQFASSLAVPPTMTRRGVSLVGRPAEQVLAFARDVSADLLVVGRQTRSWVDRLFVGSVATALLRGATISVLVTPPTA